MSAAVGVIAPNITVNGQALAEQWLDQLVSLRIEQGFGVMGRATLRFTDAGYALSTTNTFALGGTVTIDARDAGTLIDATVTGVALEQTAQEHPQLVVTADDVAYKLARGTRSRTFLSVTADDVIRKVTSEAGVTLKITSPSSVVQDYQLQAGNDLAFLDSVITRVGAVWFVEGSAFTVVPNGTSSGSVTLTLTDDLLDFTVRATGIHPTGITVNGWDPYQKQVVTAQKSSPTTGVGFDATFVSGYGSGAKLGESPAVAGDHAPISQGEAQQLAQSVLDDWVSDSVVARGSALVNPALKPGATARVANAGPASGSYLISRVEHIFTPAGFFTRFTAGGQRRTGLAEILAPSQARTAWSIDGLVIGLVTNITDEDGLGRIKVKYGGLDEQIESAWARVLAIGAGSNRGSAWGPEVNDEVLVGFEHGDPRRPIVLGSLYSSSGKLGDFGIKQDKVTARRFTSRTGHVLELSDDDADSHILLQLGTAAHKVFLGKDKFDVEVAAGIPVTIKAGDAKFEITASGDVNISGTNINLKATAQLNLEGAAGATLKSNANANVQGSIVAVKANGTGSVEASGPLSLKGAIVAIN